ncbi:MAG TPA: hypothetical protein VFS14_02055 [Candidatus Saccharimonadales bacterium]|nr:hypothetical protein [Candidatus Saccharimonadales bacterium]
MPKRLVIAVDCDDVLLPTSQAIINDYNRRFGTSLTLEDMYQPATLDRWGTDEDDVAIERVNEFLRSEEHARLAPDPAAVESIHWLAERHELHLITGRADFLKEATAQLLDTFFKGCFTSIEHTNYIVASTSTAVRRSKGDVCANINATVLIDDHLVHAEDALRTLDRVIVFGDYPWNRRDVLLDGMVRCIDWLSVTKEIDTYASR